MGTKAVLAFSSKNYGKYYTKIIGMTCDGTINNLQALTDCAMSCAKKLRCVTKFRKNDFEAINKVMHEMVKVNKNWIFIDNLKNATWVSYSAIFNPKTKLLKIYYEQFSELISTHQY